MNRIFFLTLSSIYICGISYDNINNYYPKEFLFSLLLLKRVLFSRVLLEVYPFNNPLYAIDYKGLHFTNNSVFIKGNYDFCSEFYLTQLSKMQNIGEFIFSNRYGNIMKFKSREEFENAIRTKS